jgi:isopentenyl-diphosphate delta-isomerase
MEQPERQDERWSEDPNAASRKQDHIELAFRSKLELTELDARFDYEPLLSAHPESGSLKVIDFLGKKLKAPIWVSSMTGGTKWAHTINHNLARACRDFGLGMGLGSCRSLLYSDETLADFNVRHLIGDDLPLYANLGIAQMEQLMAAGQTERIDALIEKLQADGLIIHVNPLQEVLQPEGDRFKNPPLQTIEAFLKTSRVPVVVKEVGQGMGKKSLRELLQLPIQALEFAAAGGTNFSKLELMRADTSQQEAFRSLARVGHAAHEMVLFTNELVEELGAKIRCRQIIVSGGVRDFLDGYYFINKLKLPAVYGQASGFLKYAQGDYEVLYNFVKTQINGLELAQAFLKLKC